MEQLVIVQTNLCIIENLGDQMPLKQLDNIDITKFSTMPMWDEGKNITLTFYGNKLKGGISKVGPHLQTFMTNLETQARFCCGSVQYF
jgi:hypothetical protein